MAPEDTPFPSTEGSNDSRVVRVEDNMDVHVPCGDPSERQDGSYHFSVINFRRLGEGLSESIGERRNVSSHRVGGGVREHLKNDRSVIEAMGLGYVHVFEGRF